MAQISEQAQVAEVQHRMTMKYAQVSPDRIATAVLNAHQRFEQSKIRDFVPLLVERRVRAELAVASD